MYTENLFNLIVLAWLAPALVVFPILFFFPAPYGRFKFKKGWSIPDAWGWVIMEVPAVVVFGSMFIIGSHKESTTAFVFLVMWMAHYLQRTFIYPFIHRKSQRKMPWQVVFLGFMFNTTNGYLNGGYLFTFSGGYPVNWITDWRFLLGGGLFLIGYVVNRNADKVLRDLRKKDEKEYKIPTSGLYRWISCPNYLGEVVLWLGWAIATQSLAGAAFAAWTIANLAPRAWAHHRWYKEQFDDYPEERKALLPGIW